MSAFRDRRRDDDMEDEVDYKKRRGAPDFADVEKKLQDLIVRVGDMCGTSSLESNLENLCSVLEGDIDQYRTKIIDIIASCVVYMPHKLTVYSTLVGLLNAKNYNFGGEIVEKLCADLQANLETEHYAFSLYITIFLCDLGNCKVLSLSSIVEFLEGFIEASHEDNVPQVRTDWFVYTVLHSLPWIGLELSEKKPSELDNIMQGIQTYIEGRRRAHVKLLHVWTAQATHDQEEYIDSLWAQIKQLKESGWQQRLIQRHYVAFDATLQDALQHNLPSFAAPVHKDSCTYPLPWVVFRLFDYTDCPDEGPVLPGAHSIERFLVEEELTWIIDQNCLDRKACAEQLLKYHKRNMIPLPYCILEVIFSQLFRLPSSPYSPLFYGALLIELCKLQPDTMPQVLAQAAEALYQRSDTMQPICLDRFVDWFSFHLSNFAYRWSWSDWKDCLEADDLNHRVIFAREVLEKCMRFSYYEKIKELIPEDFARIMPAKPDVRYFMDDPEDPHFEVAKAFTQLFQEKAPADRMLRELAKEGQEDVFDEGLFSVFLSVMLKIASKSFSHNFAALMRYHPTLKVVCDSSEEMQAVVLRTLYECWKNNSQYILILCDKFLKAQIIDCGVLVAWIFSDEMKHEQHRQWMWELLSTSLDRLTTHVGRMKRDLQAQRAKRENREREENGDGDAEMEDADDSALKQAEEDFEGMVDFQKNLFLDVLHKFAVALTEHVVECERNGTDYRTSWFTYMTDRFRHVFLRHEKVLWEMNSDLSEKLFSTAEIDSNVVEIYQQFVALRN